MVYVGKVPNMAEEKMGSTSSISKRWPGTIGLWRRIRMTPENICLNKRWGNILLPWEKDLASLKQGLRILILMPQIINGKANILCGCKETNYNNWKYLRLMRFLSLVVEFRCYLPFSCTLGFAVKFTLKIRFVQPSHHRMTDVAKCYRQISALEIERRGLISMEP